MPVRGTKRFCLTNPTHAEDNTRPRQAAQESFSPVRDVDGVLSRRERRIRGCRGDTHAHDIRQDERNF